MLIEFTIGNYLSFKEKRTFSMEATSIKENENNVFEIDGYRLLRGGVIYGANSSGKSNLIKALRAFEKLIKGARKLSSTDEIDVIPFKLSTETEHAPSFFEMVFLVDRKYYRYGFEVTKKEVVREWFFHKPKGEKMLFVRNRQEIELDKSIKEFSVFKNKTNANAFFLTVLDSFNEEHAKGILKYFNSEFEAALAVSDVYRLFTWASIEGKIFGETIPQFFNSLGLGFNQFRLRQDADIRPFISNYQWGTEVQLSNDDRPLPVLTMHSVLNSQGASVREVEFDLESEESTGTKKVFDILGVVAYSLHHGSFFAMDEMDANLHPLLTQKIIELYHSSVTNPKNAQLVLTTHDTNLLSYGNYRRDQIWFTEKDGMGSTDLYSLAEFKLPDGKKVRNDASYESQYLEGRYGAIPFIGNIERLVSNGGQD